MKLCLRENRCINYHKLLDRLVFVKPELVNASKRAIELTKIDFACISSRSTKSDKRTCRKSCIKNHEVKTYHSGCRFTMHMYEQQELCL